MSESRPPIEPPPDALEAAYRKASDADAGLPSEAVRQRILAHARTVAEARRPAANFPRDVPAANERYRWGAIAASFAVAVLALALWMPRERREAALAPSPERSMSSEVQPPNAAGAPGAAREAPLASDATSRAQEAYVPEPPPRAPSQALQRQVAPRAAASEAPAAAPAVEAAVPSIAAQSPRASVAGAAAAKAAAPAASATAPAPATTTAPSTARTADRAREEVAVSGARPESMPGAQSGLTATPIIVLAGHTEATLAAAIGAGDSQGVRTLVPRRIALESHDARGRTPLMLAVIAGQADIVRYLIAAGADVNAAEADGSTPLARARAAGREDLVSQLEAAGAR